jgi:hypothetical protein
LTAGIESAADFGMDKTAEPRGQTPEDTLKRIAGVPKTTEELQADAEQVEREREENARRNAGVAPEQPKQAAQPKQPSPPQQERHAERSSSSA